MEVVVLTKEVFTKNLLKEFRERRMTLTDISNEIYGHPENYRNIRRAYKRHGIEPFREEILKPTMEALKEMVINRGMTPYEIAKELGYGKHGWSNIYAYCREYGITDFDFSPNAEIKKWKIDGDIASIIHGTMLGDGSVNAKGSLSMTHGEKQLEYLKWKQEMLGWLPFQEISRRESSDVGVFSKLPTYTVRTHSHPYLKRLRKQCWDNGLKRVSPIIDSPFFNELSLAIWYFDDGSLNRNSGVVTFATNGFCLEDVHLLQTTMSDRFGIESKIEPRRTSTFAIRVNKSKTQKLFEVMMSRLPIAPPSMEYKYPCQ